MVFINNIQPASLCFMFTTFLIAGTGIDHDFRILLCSPNLKKTFLLSNIVFLHTLCLCNIISNTSYVVWTNVIIPPSISTIVIKTICFRYIYILQMWRYFNTISHTSSGTKSHPMYSLLCTNFMQRRSAFPPS